MMIYFENNKDKILYTAKHRLAFLECVKAYCPKRDLSELLKRAKYHDLDKSLMNCFCDTELSSKIHNRFCKHHKVQILPELNECDYVEMIIDWECARYTKPDKPKNAYLTMVDYFPQVEAKIMPLLIEMGLDSSENKDDQNVVMAIKNCMINNDYIKSEINDYAQNYTSAYDQYGVVSDAVKLYKKSENFNKTESEKAL